MFAFGILTTSVVKTTALTSPRQIKPQVILATPTPTPTIVEKVDYFLAYPGILPDHFLYPIKMIRDRIWLWLTVDPLKKAEVMLLFADKRLGAGRALIEGGKVDLGLSTLSKAEKYLESAFSQEKIARQSGKDTKALLEKLSKASLKHEEVLTELETKVPQDKQSTIEDLLKYAR